MQNLPKAIFSTLLSFILLTASLRSYEKSSLSYSSHPGGVGYLLEISFDDLGDPFISGQDPVFGKTINKTPADSYAGPSSKCKGRNAFTLASQEMIHIKLPNGQSVYERHLIVECQDEPFRTCYVFQARYDSDETWTEIATAPLYPVPPV